jgi:hypothetical protein
MFSAINACGGAKGLVDESKLRLLPGRQAAAQCQQMS